MYKSIAVTGADGFIGSHLCETLLKNGFSVKALCFYNSFSSAGWLDHSPYKNEFEIIFIDVRDYGRIEKVLSGAEVVIHLASLIGIPFSYESPESYIHTNIIGTFNVCKSALKNDVSHMIQTSTSEVYGSAITTPIDELHPLQAQSPYSASKISADAIAFSMYSAFDLPLTIARPFNTFGPRQSNRAVIPTIISQIFNQNSGKIVLGNIETKRDFNYVDNTVDGFLSLLNINPSGQVFNIGSGKTISIKDLVQIISKLTNSKIDIQLDNTRIRPDKSEVDELQADISKLVNLTGYSPKVTLEAGLLNTIEWIKLNKKLTNKLDRYEI